MCDYKWVLELNIGGSEGTLMQYPYHVESNPMGNAVGEFGGVNKY